MHKLQKACIWAISRDEELEQIAENNKAKIIRFPGAYKTKQDFEYDLPQNGELDDPKLIKKILSEGVSAFRSFRRKGFDTKLLDELTHRAGFSVGLGALRDIGLVLERFIDFVEQKLPGDLDQIFCEIKKHFKSNLIKFTERDNGRNLYFR